jgi:hypothetical protein
MAVEGQTNDVDETQNQEKHLEMFREQKKSSRTLLKAIVRFVFYESESKGTTGKVTEGRCGTTMLRSLDNVINFDSKAKQLE